MKLKTWLKRVDSYLFDETNTIKDRVIFYGFILVMVLVDITCISIALNT